ncbi:hypothetical protein [Devosia enhydra]|nr:hypothetical protein [Devosia enhydra]
MTISTIGRLAGIGVLTLGLAGCFDMTMDLDILSETTARSTIVQTMPSDVYQMIAQAPAGQGGFCTAEGESLEIAADGTASCTQIVEGSYADIEAADDADSFDVAVVSPGVVRITFRTESVGSEIAAEGGEDPQIMNMITSMFEGRAMTVRIIGSELIETNMTPMADGRGAELVMAFTDLIAGTADVPDELYAVVRVQQ